MKLSPLKKLRLSCVFLRWPAGQLWILLEKEAWLRTNKKTRSHRNGAAGVVSSAKCFAELTTPTASLRNGNFLLMSRPPLLFKEGKKANSHFSIIKNGQSPVAG